MKRVLSFLSVLIGISCNVPASDGSNLRVSLLTCSKGNDIASDFGHSAIRVTDSLSGQDIVFNFGTYDFEAPHFVLKFMRGQMDYLLSICYYSDFIASYSEDNRAVTEREFLLSPSDRNRVYSVLVETYNSPARRYRYDYFINNCATRIRDIFFGSKSAVPEVFHLEHTGRYTFRTAYGELYLYDLPWLMFGLDMLMGARLDRPISFAEEMYLPALLEENLSRCSFISDSLPMLGSPVEVVGNSPVGKTAVQRILTPVTVFSGICILTALLVAIFRKRKKIVGAVSRSVYLIVGLTGVLMTVMWFGTEHYWTGANWNLLWASPLFLIPAFIREGRMRRWIVSVLTGIAVLTVALQHFIPQELNVAVIPIVILLAVIAAGEMFSHSLKIEK